MANSSTTTLLQDIIWYTDPFLLLATAYLLRKRDRLQAFPFFALYLLWVASKTYVVLAVDHWYGIKSWPYFYSSYIADGFAIGLSFFVLYEVLSNILTSGTVRVQASTFAIVNATLFIVVTTLTIMTGHQYHNQTIMNSLLTVDVLLRYVQIGVLLLFWILTAFFGFYWVDQAFGVVLGFGFYAAMVIVNSELYGKIGVRYSHNYHLVDVLAYYLASCIWFSYAAKKLKLPNNSLPSDKVSEYTEPIERLIR